MSDALLSAVALVNQLEQEKPCNKIGQMAHRLARLDTVVLDKLAYLPFSASGGALLGARACGNQVPCTAPALGSPAARVCQSGSHERLEMAP